MVSVEEELPAGRLFEHGGGRRAEQLHYEGELLLLGFAWEQRVPREELGQYAPERPHVYCWLIRNAQNDLRRSVESALDVGVDPFVLEAARAEVNELDAALVGTLQQDVLGLQVAVNDLLLPQKLERLQDLNSESTDERERDALEVVVLNEFVQVDREQLKRYHQVLAEDHIVL